MSATHAPSKPKILVVEDSYLTAETVCEMVVKFGCDVVGAVGRVETGVQFIRDHQVDGAVVDIDLNGTASFPICEQLKKRDIPFVFMTGYDRPYPVPEEFRMAPWLQKPVDHRQFEAALAGLARASVRDAGRGNLVLERLPVVDWLALQPNLELVTLKAGDVLGAVDQPTRYVHFPISGLISVSARTARGKGVEVALVGSEGVTGLEVALGKTSSFGTETVVQFAGAAWRIASDKLMALLEVRRGLRAELLSTLHSFVGQMSDTAVAIGNGTIEQRLARRLLMASMRLGTRHLALTHDALARLMAVRRSGITVALHMLEARHLIRSRRNLVEILDSEGLLRAADGEDMAPKDQPAASRSAA